MKHIDLLDEEEASSPSYFQWREQTVRMAAVRPVAAQPQGSAIVRLFRRLARKD